MKKMLSIILALTFVISTATVTFAATEPIKATKTSSAVMVNGKEVKFEAYNINNNNYFKLRDIAKALNGSEKQFEVTLDGAKNAINLVTGKAYTVVGGELEVGKSNKLNVRNTDSRIYVDGIEVSMKAYNINDNNYFKLRDLGEFIGFSVDWDGANNKILISTKQETKQQPKQETKQQPKQETPPVEKEKPDDNSQNSDGADPTVGRPGSEDTAPIPEEMRNGQKNFNWHN